MVQAYILIQTEVGKPPRSPRRSPSIEGVLVAEDVTGPYDVIARVEAHNVDELGKLVIARVQEVPGITRTLDLHRRPHLSRPVAGPAPAPSLLALALLPVGLAGCSARRAHGAAPAGRPTRRARASRARLPTPCWAGPAPTRPDPARPGRLGRSRRSSCAAASPRPARRPTVPRRSTASTGSCSRSSDGYELHDVRPGPGGPGAGAEALRARGVRPHRPERGRSADPHRARTAAREPTRPRRLVSAGRSGGAARAAAAGRPAPGSPARLSPTSAGTSRPA